MAEEEGYVFLPDEPITSVEEDEFQHLEYVDSLEEILRDASPPWNIGIFGEWGIGKTSIIRLLFERIEQSSAFSDTVCVEYDAWKHAEESIRTDLLLSLDRQLGESLDKEVDGKPAVLGEDRITRELYDVDIEEEQEDLSIGEEIRRLFTESRAIGAITAAVLAAIVIVAGLKLLNIAGITSINSSTLATTNVILDTLLIPLFLGLFLFMARQVRTATSSLRQQYPRKEWSGAYENLFDEMIAQTGQDRVFISVDNLDRCESDTVYDVLISLKTFMDNEHCIYLIPCDDDALYSHIQSIDKGDYFEETENEREFFRKFFQTHIRLPPLLSEDIDQYVQELNQELQEPYDSDVLEVITKAYVRNPRRVKQAINRVTTLRLIAEEIEETASLADGVITNHLPFLAKVSILEEEFPDFYSELENDPGLLEDIREFYRGKTLDGGRQSKISELLGPEEGRRVNEETRLESFLRATRWTTVDDPKPFLFLNQPSWSTSLPDVNQVIQDLRAGRVSEATEAIQQGLEDGGSFNVYYRPISETLNEYRETGREESLYSTIDGLLEIYDILDDDDQERLAETIAEYLVTDYLVSTDHSEVLLNFDPDQLFPVMADMPREDADELFVEYAELVAEDQGIRRNILVGFTSWAEQVPDLAVNRLSSAIVGTRSDPGVFGDAVELLLRNDASRQHLITDEIRRSAVDRIGIDENRTEFENTELSKKLNQHASRAARSYHIEYLLDMVEDFEGDHEDQEVKNLRNELYDELLDIDGKLESEVAKRVFETMRESVNSQGGQPNQPVEVCMHFYDSFDEATAADFHEWIADLLDSWNHNGVQQIVQAADQHGVPVFKSKGAVQGVLRRVPDVVGNQTFFINTLIPAVPADHNSELIEMANQLVESDDHSDTLLLAQIFTEYPDRFEEIQETIIDRIQDQYHNTSNVTHQKEYVMAEAVGYHRFENKEEYIGRLTSFLTGEPNEHQAFQEVWSNVGEQIDPEQREILARDVQQQVLQELQGDQVDQRVLDPLINVFQSLAASGDVPADTGSELIERLSAKLRDDNVGNNPTQRAIGYLADFSDFYGEEERTLNRLETAINRNNFNPDKNTVDRLLTTLEKTGNIDADRIEDVRQIL